MMVMITVDVGPMKVLVSALLSQMSPSSLPRRLRHALFRCHFCGGWRFTSHGGRVHRWIKRKMSTQSSTTASANNRWDMVYNMIYCNKVDQGQSQIWYVPRNSLTPRNYEDSTVFFRSLIGPKVLAYPTKMAYYQTAYGQFPLHMNGTVGVCVLKPSTSWTWPTFMSHLLNT